MIRKMHHRICRISLLALIALGQQPLFSATSKLTYPAAPRENVVDDYHGVPVPDPYRWLENPDAARSRRWISEENALTDSYLRDAPNQGQIKERLTRLFMATSYPSQGSPLTKRGERYFFLRREGAMDQPVLYWMSSRSAAPKALLDPNKLSREGTAALLSWSVSNDGKMLAYGIARAGSDWQTIFFRDVDSGVDRPDKLEWSKFSVPEWSFNGEGVYYGRYPKPAEKEALTTANYNQTVSFHKLGTQQSADELIYERPDHKEWGFYPRVTVDGKYLILSVSEGTRPENLIFYRDLSRPQSKFVERVSKFEAQYDFIGNRGSLFYFHTTLNAPKGRVISMTADNGAVKEIVGQTADVMDQAVLNDDSLYLVYEKDVASVAFKCNLAGGQKREIALPGKGNVIWAERILHSHEQFFSFLGFTEPRTLYSLDEATWHAKPFAESKLPFDPAAFETRQVFYPSKDGTRIPMFLIGRKGFTANPNTPCLLWGYGGFDISTTPEYAPLYLEWIELGGIVASANMRGGGEYGEQWHQAGMKDKKQNVFDDFVAAAEWLESNKYTSRNKLAIFGWSNGGLLIGATLNQHPNLFGAAVAGAGVMDMLRFDQFTIGHAWTSEYGSPQNPADFKVIRAYSPLHNVREGTHYPPTLVMTADHDDRVVPAHSFKYAATMQHAQGGPAPILIHIDTQAGHGSGKPIAKRVNDDATILAFLMKSLGMEAEPNRTATLRQP